MTEKMTFYHNPRCSKSRASHEILTQRGVDFHEVRYLDSPPSEASLREILTLLQLKPIELMRKGEKVFAQKVKGMGLNDDALIQVMLENPILIERPIFVHNGKAVIGRPPEKILEIL